MSIITLNNDVITYNEILSEIYRSYFLVLLVFLY
jgi:hypothetical protein